MTTSCWFRCYVDHHTVTSCAPWTNQKEKEKKQDSLVFSEFARHPCIELETAGYFFPARHLNFNAVLCPCKIESNLPIHINPAYNPNSKVSHLRWCQFGIVRGIILFKKNAVSSIPPKHHRNTAKTPQKHHKTWARLKTSPNTVKT